MNDQRLQLILADLEQWEGRTTYLYNDSATPPNVTVGVGCLLKSAAVSQSLPWVNVGWSRPATAAEIAADFLRVAAMPGGRLCPTYRAVPPQMQLELKPADVTALGVHRLRETFVPGLHALCPTFDEFPEPAQSALVDMAWNLGMRGLAKFEHLIAACNAGDWATAARECSVRTSRYSRNAWRSAQFVAALRADASA